jgi:xanthine dehydrogenase YagT iron-sulfur-binding subunit
MPRSYRSCTTSKKSTTRHEDPAARHVPLSACALIQECAFRRKHSYFVLLGLRAFGEMVCPPDAPLQGTAMDPSALSPVSKAEAANSILAPNAPELRNHAVSLNVNGHRCRVDVPSWVTLLDLLRDQLDLTGTKKGCDHGQCGACTVLVDGNRINACLTLAVMQEGRHIVTVEGLANGEALHPLQQAFIEHDAFQCGYCTPGQLCSAVGLIKEGHARTESELRELMSGNICRCGAYPQIVQAIGEVAGIPVGRTADGQRRIVIGKVPA